MTITDLPPTEEQPAAPASSKRAKRTATVPAQRVHTEMLAYASIDVPADELGADPALPGPREAHAGRVVFAVTRIAVGFVFLWAFLDKAFGLGISTPSDKAWIHGGSPTTGYLKGVQGPFGDVFHSIAGATWADWLFMIGLLGIGLALVLGIGMRIAAATGALLLVFMWTASLPIKTNPFLDDHLVYAAVLIGLALTRAGNTLGLGRWWNRTKTVNRFPVLR